MTRHHDFRAPRKPHITPHAGGWLVLWRGRISPQPTFKAACERALTFGNVGRKPAD